jgi:hypothetical protein
MSLIRGFPQGVDMGQKEPIKTHRPPPAWQPKDDMRNPESVTGPSHRPAMDGEIRSEGGASDMRGGDV